MDAINLTVPPSSNLSPMEWAAQQDPISIKTAELVRFCGEFSTQIKTAAIIGLLLTIIALFYFGRWRPAVLSSLGDKAVWIDKALIIGIGMCFAVIITRAFYGG